MSRRFVLLVCLVMAGCRSGPGPAPNVTGQNASPGMLVARPGEQPAYIIPAGSSPPDGFQIVGPAPPQPEPKLNPLQMAVLMTCAFIYFCTPFAPADWTPL